MDGDDIHTSLQQLRLQLDLMNKRTASVLNKSRQHSTKVTHDSSQVGQLPSVIMADYAQQIKHIGATAEPYFDLSFGKSSDIPRQTSGMPSATVADVGGYFYPNHIQYTHNNQQYISDALTFVGRVNRTLRTKSINNIEIFLRGSALRWFHIGLRIDGSHIFDHGSGEMNIAKFCQSLILLFGVPKSSRPESDNEAARLKVSSMRSGILDDYAFPALENARQQGVDFDFDVVLKKAIKRYNKSSIPASVDPNILKNKDLLEMLVCLRRSEFDQKLDKVLTPQGHYANEVTRAKVTSESIKGPGETSNEVKQDSVSETANELFGDTPSLTTIAASGDPSSSKSDCPEPRIKIITGLPAARDCCGEKVLNPVEHKQKMCQGINFLADEGAEILSDFEEKLAALKKWLHKNHTHEDSDDEIKLLWHRVAYMIWIHEQRILESSEQHFIRSQDSDSEFVYETKKPSRGHQRPFVSNSTTTGRTENPKNQIVRAQEKVCILDNRSEKAAVALNLETPKMLELFKPKVVESIEAADEPYPPAPTAESCPTTPIVPCQVAANPLNSSELDHNIPVSPKTAKKFGLQPGRQLSQQQLLQMQQQMHMQRMAQQQKNTMKMEKTAQTNNCSQNIPHQQSPVLKPQDRSGRSSVDIGRGCHTNVLGSTNVNSSTLSSYEPLEQASTDLSRTRSEQVFAQLPDHLKDRSVRLPHSASAGMNKHTTISNYDTIERLKPPRAFPIHETKKDETERTKNAAEEMLTTTIHDYQHDTSSIDPYSYVSGCTGAKEPLEEYLKHLELGSLDDQDWTHYAQMLKDHAAAVAEEDNHSIKIPHKPFWHEREAMEAAGEIARSQKYRRW
ncbi:unnamed protein product [Aureobasidium mustum]|uniref:Uncharacterized protein n=1 Tax=Aureobasidium mustum TaxID=2773714 RepID=A0A9N8JS43_9PEZI|nr:unnamed protein product [Aureobasidium mustum]